MAYLPKHRIYSTMCSDKNSVFSGCAQMSWNSNCLTNAELRTSVFTCEYACPQTIEIVSPYKRVHNAYDAATQNGKIPLRPTVWGYCLLSKAAVGKTSLCLKLIKDSLAPCVLQCFYLPHHFLAFSSQAGLNFPRRTTRNKNMCRRYLRPKPIGPAIVPPRLLYPCYRPSQAGK